MYLMKHCLLVSNKLSYYSDGFINHNCIGRGYDDFLLQLNNWYLNSKIPKPEFQPLKLALYVLYYLKSYIENKVEAHLTKAMTYLYLARIESTQEQNYDNKVYDGISKGKRKGDVNVYAWVHYQLLTKLPSYIIKENIALNFINNSNCGFVKFSSKQLGGIIEWILKLDYKKMANKFKSRWLCL